MRSQFRMGTSRNALVDDSAGNIMSSSTKSTLLLLLAKLVDKDPNVRRSSVEAIKELMQKKVHEQDTMSAFIETLLGSLDKKSKHSLVSASTDQSCYSLLVQSSTFLLAEMANHATLQHFKLRLLHIASIVKHLVSWFPLDNGGSSSHSLHQACAKLVCSLAENAALMNDDYSTSKSSPACSSLNASGSSTVLHNNTAEFDDTCSSTGSCIDEDPIEHAGNAMESLCRPLIAALCSKVEPTSRGATICLEALVSKDSWRFASPSLIEDLCLKAANRIQERTALSASTAQMSLLCNLAKKNHESLSCFRVALLKKGVDILLNSGAWQQKVAAARLIECLLSMGGHTSIESEHDKQPVRQAIESLEQCRLDKVAMVRSAVSEALKKAKDLQGSDKGNAISPPGRYAMASTSPTTATKVDYRKRRRKKPLSSGPYERQPALFSSPTSLRSDPFYGNDRRVNQVTPSSGWSSSDSVNSSIDVKCPRKKVAKTGDWNGKTGSTLKKNEQVINVLLSSSSSSSTSSSLSPSSPLPPPTSSSSSSTTSAAPSSTNRKNEHLFNLSSSAPSPKTSLSSPLPPPTTSSSTTSAAPSSVSVISYNSTDKNVKSSFHPCTEEITKNGSPLPHKLMDSLVTEPISSCSSSEDVWLTHIADGITSACGAEQECTTCVTPTYIHHNPIAELEGLEEVEGHEQVGKFATNISDVVLSTTPLSLLLRKQEHVQLQYTDVADGMKRKELGNDSSWNVRNNPMATDDSELDSPRPTVFDNYSIIYCDDGDDDDDVNAQERHPDCDGGSPLHARQQNEDVDGDGCLVDEGICGTVDDRKQADFNAFEDHVVENNCGPDAHDRYGDVDIAEKQPHEGQYPCVYSFENNVASVPTKKVAEALSGKCEAKVLVSNQMLREDGESQKHEDMCYASAGHNLIACTSGPKVYCDACYRNVSTQDGGSGHAFINEVVIVKDHISNQLEEYCNQAVPHPLVAINEHEGVGDNFDEFACLNVTCQALCNEADWESAKEEFPVRDCRLQGIITHAEDMQALIKPAIAIEAVQAGPLQQSFACGENTDSRGDAEEEDSNSVLGWLTKCYVVKKLGAFGALFLALTIPVAIVSIINTFDTKEEAIDFLVPT